MKGAFVLVLICLAVYETVAADTLECYQCNPVTQECTADKVDSVKCGTMQNSRCSKQVKKGGDGSKAIRKCVVPGANGQISCPSDFDCYNCDSNLCNAGSVTKFTWVSLSGVFLSILYML